MVSIIKELVLNDRNYFKKIFEKNKYRDRAHGKISLITRRTIKTIKIIIWVVTSGYGVKVLTIPKNADFKCSFQFVFFTLFRQNAHRLFKTGDEWPPIDDTFGSLAMRLRTIQTVSSQVNVLLVRGCSQSWLD
jgi:hypothetical protein